ncbi:hypothetical protein FHN55_22120, partial [Streptomyces sp. NP160]|uniref:hypothetical protein n=1 Tax=Streptomyces sp. NP160 TaxID=2586637 RepID=UPI00116E0AEB
MTSSAPPEWAVGDGADLPGPSGLRVWCGADTLDLGDDFWDAVSLDVLLDGAIGDDLQDVSDAARDEGDEAHLVPFSSPWWSHQLLLDPLTGSIAERQRIRPAIAAAVAGDPGPAQVAALDALHAALG